MRMKMVCDDRTLEEAANEFLALKKAQKVRERTLNDYKKYIDKFLEQSQNSLDVDVLKMEILEYFADIPKTSPARFNHPYQYLHALFAWAAKQDYIPYNPFEKLELKKVRDEGNVQPAEIRDIQTFLKALDKHNYTELRDYNIVLLMLDTGIRTSELMAIRNAANAHESIVLAIEEEMCYIVEQVEKQAESQMELPVAIKSVIHQVNRRIRKWWLIWKGGGRRWRTMLWVTSMGKQTASMRC